VDIARALGDSPLLTRALMYQGQLELFGRSAPMGKATHGEILRMIEAAGTPYFAVPIHAFVSFAGYFDGELDEARSHAREALRLGRPMRYHAFVSMALGHLGLLDALAGETSDAASHFDEAREIAHRASLGTFEVAALWYEAAAEYAQGNSERALDLAERALSFLTMQGNRPTGAFCRWTAGVAALLLGDRAKAKVHLEAARRDSIDPCYPAQFGRATVGLAQLAADEDDLDGAWAFAHSALQILSEFGDRLGTATALDAIARVAVLTGRPEMGARLLGATERIYQATGIARPPLEADRHPRSVDEARASLGGEEFDRCWADGVAMSEEEAVLYAQRGRGERGRPASGWQSLTPSELEVVRHVAEGSSNAEIAERLYVSPNTVKTHLSHVYTKLDLSSRAELAAEAARRDL